MKKAAETRTKRLQRLTKKEAIRVEFDSEHELLDRYYISVAAMDNRW